jgi:tetratricopeptide (TPR) repeat protein
MPSDSFAELCLILALETVGSHTGTETSPYVTIAASVLLVIALVAYGFRCFAHSDDRRVLLYKWAATAASCFLCVALFQHAKREPREALFFTLPCLVLGLIWMPNLVEFLLKPLTGAFDGGFDEVEAQPFYFIAAAKRAKGLHQEAIAEIRKQLEKFPGDAAGFMLLSSIQAEDLRDLPGAQATLNELLHDLDLTPQQRATALQTLADWQLQLGRDVPAARATLERIVMALPDSQFAHAAEQRIAALEGAAATRDFRENARFEVRQRERDIGLRHTSQPEPEALDADELAAQYVAQLGAHPSDTATREKLAVLYAEQFDRLDLAVDQLEQLIGLPDETPKHVARWLNLLATLLITVAHDEAAARTALLRIGQKFPKSAAAEVATMRLMRLGNEMKSSALAPSKALGIYEKDLGLKNPPG